jgi:DNA-binding NarL/FixJ family response regulator
MALRTLLADDHALMRAGLRSLLEEMAGVEVVAEAADGHEALRLIGELKPDVALFDISMPGLNGLEAAARAAREHPRTRVIILSMHVLSMHVDDEYVRRALAAGAAGYLLKSSDPSELEMALRAVGRGESWLAPEVSSRVMAYARGDKSGGSGPLELLTPRQREVLQLIAEGHSNKEIAHRLNLGVKTVETHRSELMERLDIHGTAGLVRYAIRVGIAHPGP